MRPEWVRGKVFVIFSAGAPSVAHDNGLLQSGGSRSQTRFTTEAAEGNREDGGWASRLISCRPSGTLKQRRVDTTFNQLHSARYGFVTRRRR